MLTRRAILVLMPRLAPVMKSARLLEWLKKPGDRIEPYELLFRVETDSLLESQPAGVSHRLDIECCDPAVFAKALVEPGSEEILPDTPIAVLCEHPDDIPHIDGAQGGNTMVWQAYLSSRLCTGIKSDSISSPRRILESKAGITAFGIQVMEMSHSFCDYTSCPILPGTRMNLSIGQLVPSYAPAHRSETNNLSSASFSKINSRGKKRCTKLEITEMGQSNRKPRAIPNPVGIEAYVPPTVHYDDLSNISFEEDLYFELARRSTWKQFDVRRLHLMFKSACGGNAEMKVGEFGNIFFGDEQRSDEIVKKWIDSVFMLFDDKSRGFIDFAQFVIALRKFYTASFQEKVEILFCMFDFNKDEQLDEDEVKAMFQICRDFIILKEESTDEVLVKIFASLETEKKFASLDSLKGWVVNYFDIEKFFNKFYILPSVDEERIAIKKLIDEAKLEVGEEWFVISSKWWQSWKDYCDYEQREAQPENSTRQVAESDKDSTSTSLKAKEFRHSRRPSAASLIVAQRPNSIDNNDIQDHRFPLTLKKTIQEREDFILLPKAAWNLLQIWYGGGPAFPRKVIELGKENKILQVELYPIYMSFVTLKKEEAEPLEKTKPIKIISKLVPKKKPKIEYDEHSEISFLFSSYEKYSDLKTRLAEKLELSSSISFRFWFMEQKKWKLFSEQVSADSSQENQSITSVSDKTLEELQFESGEFVLVEVSSKDGSWPLKEIESLQERSWKQFEVEQSLDVKDFKRKWYKAQIVKIDEAKNEMFVHYDEFAPKWDEWMSLDAICDCKEGTLKCEVDGHRLAKLHTYTEKAQETEDSYKGRLSARAENVKGKSIERGVCGLHNLGNTCFMNSIIQCLSNCPVLTNFFLDARYVRDINKENPLGLKGKLANSYTSLLKEIWSGEYRAVAPSEFKKALSDFAPRFSGYQQHDSQELLAFMLDGLHEDLNRIKLKPYTKSVEDQGRTDTEIAEESWKMHLMRNQSIIVDLFQGQLKSTVTCPDCSRISITFDPFMFLSVPLPSKESRLVKLELLGVKGRPSMIYGVDITDLTKMSQLIEHLAKLSGIDSRLLVVSEYADSNISRVFPEAYDLRNLRMDEKLIVCEQSEQTLTTNSSDWVGVLFSYSKDDGMYRFGIPFMIMFDTKSTSNNEFHTLLKERLEHLVPEEELSNPDLYEVRIMNSKLNHCGVCGSNSCQGCKLERNDELTTVPHDARLVVLWNQKVVSKVRERISTRKIHESAEKRENAFRINIYDCIKLFTRPERLGKDDAWYCSNCKDFRQATKKFDIWKSPEILIIHLKRFQVVGSRREKISIPVEFPIQGLSLKDIALDPADSQPVYDLFAISNHFGGLGGGHYIAYAKNLKNQQWYEFDDSRISNISPSTLVSSSNYVLLYKRRH